MVYVGTSGENGDGSRALDACKTRRNLFLPSNIALQNRGKALHMYLMSIDHGRVAIETISGPPADPLFKVGRKDETDGVCWNKDSPTSLPCTISQ